MIKWGTLWQQSENYLYPCELSFIENPDKALSQGQTYNLMNLQLSVLEKLNILTSKAFVPLSIKSSFVNTPNVLSPKRQTF